MWTSLAVGRGQTLKVGAIHGGSTGGSRAYLAFAGGLDVPDYLGSKSTFPGGNMGGHQGRALRTGDMLFLLPTGGCCCTCAGGCWAATLQELYQHHS